jgi:hypothetical protein
MTPTEAVRLLQRPPSEVVFNALRLDEHARTRQPTSRPTRPTVRPMPVSRQPDGEELRWEHPGVGPAVPLICEFITEHRQEFVVAPICRALTEAGLPIASRTVSDVLDR